ncbi:hypothetical protein H0901_03750 [Microcystis aeruginosa BLCCF158]|uniref:Uncharacterized protein n=1 Tax=Microcystis aeruginosa BLCC-F158 TaxID=2755316 RepID=A0A841V068_MICAE|nr:hypothetical protein [Microcystis aeruginosa]MBC1194420.1 hypothetical protein [Microcystis aeruginosa BLCC-F158]
MRKLAWQKLAPLLLCGLIATGCDQDKNSLTEPINWQSILSESLADLDLENISVDQLLGILNSLSLFPDDIIGIDENCLAEIGDIGSSLASNRSVTCQLQLSNGEWVSIVVNRDLFGLDNIPNNNLQSGLSFTFDPLGETTTNPDPEIRNPVGENWLSVETMTGNWGSIDNWGSAGVMGSIDNWGSAGVMYSIDNWGSAGVITGNWGSIDNWGNWVSVGVINYSGISTSPILFDPFNPGQPVNVSESNSIASLGFFSILLFGQRTFQYFRRQYQAKKVKK